MWQCGNNNLQHLDNVQGVHKWWHSTDWTCYRDILIFRNTNSFSETPSHKQGLNILNIHDCDCRQNMPCDLYLYLVLHLFLMLFLFNQVLIICFILGKSKLQLSTHNKLKVLSSSFHLWLKQINLISAFTKERLIKFLLKCHKKVTKKWNNG